MSTSQNPTQTCTFCPRLCRHTCPTAIGEFRETLIPTLKMNLVLLHERGDLPLDEELAEIYYACTGCGACTAFCKHGQRPQDVLYQGREAIVENNIAPPVVYDLIENYRQHHNPFGPDLPFIENITTDAYVLLLGDCTQRKHANSSLQALRDALQLVTSSTVSFVPPDFCCGDYLYATGERNLYQAHARQFAQKVQGIERIVILDPACGHHLAQQYAAAHIQFTPHIEFYFEAFLERWPNSANTHQTTPTPVFYHDPPSLRRFAQQMDAPRQLLQKFGYHVLEFTRNREQSAASGAGGIYRWTSPKGAAQAARWRLQEVRQYAQIHRLSSPPAVITVGERERHHLAKSNPDLTILDLNQLLADKLLKTNSTPPTTTPTNPI